METMTERHTIGVLVDNEAGVLARVVGLFSGRGYNIDSLTVAEVDQNENQSRITIVTTGTPQVIEQIKAQLGRLVPIHGVTDLRESTVALFNGHPGDGAKVLLETPYDPLLQPVLDAAENGELWVFCLQYMSQGTHLTRFWYVEGSQPSDDTLIDHWIVRIV